MGVGKLRICYHVVNKVKSLYLGALWLMVEAAPKIQVFLPFLRTIRLLISSSACGTVFIIKKGGHPVNHILIIEDDKTLSGGIALALKGSGLEIHQATGIREAKAVMDAADIQLILLDINLPDGSGLDFLNDFRKYSHKPVILLTANDTETDIVTGLELGADDYITKPFSLAVLRARVNTQLRRIQTLSPESLSLGEFVFDFEKMIFTKHGISIELSKTEQKLLRLLAVNRGQTIPRAELVDRIWSDGADYVDENALSVTVKRLRDKLEDQPSAPRYIKTVYGVGYTWAVK